MSPNLVNIPGELLERIAVHCTLSTPPFHPEPTVASALEAFPYGPPGGLQPLLLTCRSIHDKLSFARNPALYASIFQQRFDCSAARRRLGARAVTSRAQADQLKKYSQCLTRTRRRVLAPNSLEWVQQPSRSHLGAGGAMGRTYRTGGDGDVEDDDWQGPQLLDEDLWTMTLMMLECDGRNEAQLRYYAHADVLVDRYVRERLWDGRDMNNGWAVENTRNTLVLWLMWMMSDVESLRHEPHELRQQVIRLVFPYVVLGFRYPMFYVPDNHFALPLRANLQGEHIESSVATAHGVWPLYRDILTQNSVFSSSPPSPSSSSFGSPTSLPPNMPLIHTHVHFGATLYLTPPPLAPFAALVYFSRQEQEPIQVPEHVPPNRAVADALGWGRPSETREDYEELAAFPHAKVPRAGAKVILRVPESGAASGTTASTGDTTVLGTQAPQPTYVEWELPDWDWRASLTPLQRRIEDGMGGYGDAFPHFHGYPHPAFSEEPKGRSAAWEEDWARITSCGDPFYLQPSMARQTYKPGCLDGLWQGRQLVPVPTQYTNLLASKHAPAEDLRDSRLFCSSRAIVVCLKEHYLLDGDPANAPAKRARWTRQSTGGQTAASSSKEEQDDDDELAVVPAGGPRDEADPDFGFDDGVRNGWLPYCRMRKSPNAVHVVDTQGSAGPQEYRYETHQPGAPLSVPHNPSKCHVCRIEKAEAEEPRGSPRRHTESEDYEMKGEGSGLRFEKGRIPGLSDEDRSRLVEEGFKAAGMEDVDMDDMDDDGMDVERDIQMDAYESDWQGWKRPCQGIRDILVTGSVLPRHAAAWLDCEYYGRVRPYDGLVALVRIERLFPGRPINRPTGAAADVQVPRSYIAALPHTAQPFPKSYSDLLGLPNVMSGPIGLWVFRGQLIGGQNLVGRWRAMTQDIGTPPWEGPFTLSRRPTDT